MYVHNDMWYIHPYAGQQEGKSFASVTAKGKWRIKTVKREYSVDEVAAVALDNCDVSNVPATIGNVSRLKPNHGIFTLRLAGTKYQGML